MTAVAKSRSTGRVPSGGAPRSTGARVTTAVLALVLIGAIVVATERALEWREAVARQQARAAVLEAAEAEVLGLITISARTTDEDLESLIAGATASFKEDLRAQADRLREEVVDNEVEATGEIVSAGIASFDGERATVLVAARGTVDNRNASVPEPRNYRLEVGLEKVDDGWLVATLRFVA